MKWDRVLRDCVKNNSIRELHLRNIPSLKTVTDWNKVKEIGLVDYETKYAHYKGGLVKYGERIFYVNESRIEAVSAYRNWKFAAKIKVISEEDRKK